MVVIKDGSAVSGTPVPGTTYADSTLFGSGDMLNAGEYVVYDGSGSSVAITGLLPGHTYYLTAFEYNCGIGQQLYLVPGESTSAATYTLSGGTPPEASYCVTATTGAPTTVFFSSTGTFNGNTYTAFLSDAAGSFAAPITIGSVASDANSGSISCLLPAGTPFGTGYRIRISSSSPAYTSTPGAAFTVSLYNPAINLGNDVTLCADQSVVLDAGAGYIEYEWSDGSGLQTLAVDSALIGPGTSVITVQVTSLYGCLSSDTILVSLSPCTGLTESPETSSLLLWPNPAGTTLFVSFRENQTCAVQLQLLDCTGRLLEQRWCEAPLSGHHEQIRMESFPAGIYVLKEISGSTVRDYKVLHY
jgi:hypothetical protein